MFMVVLRRRNDDGTWDYHVPPPKVYTRREEAEKYFTDYVMGNSTWLNKSPGFYVFNIREEPYVLPEELSDDAWTTADATTLVLRLALLSAATNGQQQAANSAITSRAMTVAKWRVLANTFRDTGTLEPSDIRAGLLTLVADGTISMADMAVPEAAEAADLHHVEAGEAVLAQ